MPQDVRECRSQSLRADRNAARSGNACSEDCMSAELRTDHANADFLSRYPQDTFLPGKKVREEKHWEPLPKSRHLPGENAVDPSSLPLKCHWSLERKQKKDTRLEKGLDQAMEPSKQRKDFAFLIPGGRVILSKAWTDHETYMQQYPGTDIGKKQDTAVCRQQEAERAQQEDAEKRGNRLAGETGNGVEEPNNIQDSPETGMED
ncbi:hypothetical protein NDU88_001822 [Pleurodeles waltl]|uniref:Uncharacterized protein n=1 Tax=Pleurodeles waltl TaxID=8319 RepID=A0AAV7VCU4_PLEWA|nr:hypothetical protein NDU88_001822 [Pleurodeles waltl]